MEKFDIHCMTWYTKPEDDTPKIEEALAYFTPRIPEEHWIHELRHERDRWVCLYSHE